MKIGSIRREIRILRLYALLTTIAAGIFLLGAIRESKTVAFDTITVHRINVIDRAGKLAMVLTDHDDFPSPIVNWKTIKRSSGNDENGIVFYNQLGNEQGALIWDGRIAKNGTYSSGVTLSYDSVKTDQLLQVDDSNVNGHQNAYVTGWNEPDFTGPGYDRYIRDWQAAKTDDERRAVRLKYPQFRAHKRFFFGYDDEQSRVTLHDGKGNARINMFVNAEGAAKLQFLDESGKVTYELPR